MDRVKLVFAVSALSFAGAAAAHHSFAAVYDMEKSVTVAGVVTEVQWLNPHAHFYVDVETEDGTVANWDFELNSPNGLMRLGWTRKSLQPGDSISVTGIPARDGSNRGSARQVTLADGRQVFSGEPNQDGLR